MIFHLLIQSKVCTRRKKEDRRMNIRNIPCQQAVGFIPKKPFSRRPQSFPSICQTLLSHNQRSLVITRFHSLTALDHFPSSQTALSGFQSRYLFCSQAALSGFQLDLFFFLFKLPFRVFTLNLFPFLFLPKMPFRVFNSDKSFFWWSQA